MEGRRTRPETAGEIFFILLGGLLLIVFILSAIADVNTLDRVRDDADIEDYLRAIGGSAIYLLAAIVSWVGAAILGRMPPP
jgi:hypothetical protein